MKNLTFHGLLKLKMNTIVIILTISLIHFSFKGWNNYHSELWSEKVEGVTMRRMQREEGGERKQENNKQAADATGQ